MTIMSVTKYMCWNFQIGFFGTDFSTLNLPTNPRDFVFFYNFFQFRFGIFKVRKSDTYDSLMENPYTILEYLTMKNKLEFGNLIELIFPNFRIFGIFRFFGTGLERSMLGVFNVLERIKPLRNEFNSVL